jgi:thioredoxin reductase (NADPH)
MPGFDPRDERMFPKLTSAEIDRLLRFGQMQRYSKDQPLFVTGEIAPGMFVVKVGRVKMTRRDPLGHLAPIVERGPGDFVGEVGQLSGRPALVDVHAVEDVEALLIPPENLRAVMIAEPELGDRIMRALILRRVVVIETGAGGPVLIGPEDAPDVVRLQGFLTRNAYPCQVLDPAVDRDAADLVEKYAPTPTDLPLAVCPKGTILNNPSEAELARALGMVRIDEQGRIYDVAIRRRTGGSCDRRLCGVGGTFGCGLRREGVRRTSRSECPDRELSWIPDRHIRPNAHGTGLCSGAKIRRRDGDSDRGRTPELQSKSSYVGTQ